MKNILLICVGGIVFLVGMVVVETTVGLFGKKVGKYIAESTSSEPTQKPKQVDYKSKTYLNKVAEEMNNKIGKSKQLDEDTTLEYVDAEQGKIIFHYQIITYSVDELYTTVFLNEDKKESRKRFCSNDGTKMLLYKDITFVSTYIDKNGDTIGEVSITKNDCE